MIDLDRSLIFFKPIPSFKILTSNPIPSSLTLNYQPNGSSSIPNNYQWMRENNPLAITTVGTFTVNESGSYWVKTQDSKGCTSETFSSPAAFVMIPDATILGPDAVCEGQSFQLSGFAGGSTTQYQWLKGTVIIANWSTTNYQIEDVLQGAGQNFDYSLKIRVPNGTGWCYSTPLVKTVSVVGPPSIPVVTVATTANSCNPYSLNVSASSNDLGTFTWSNGQSTLNSYSSNIEVFQGGPLQVTFTNSGGRSASTTVLIPKDPSVYMWVFPDGCYKSCTRPDEFLIGPNEEFANWQWNVDGVSALNGNGFVENLPLPGTSSTVNLFLDNGLCSRTSKSMSLNVVNCRDCRLEPILLKLEPKTEPFCEYILEYEFTNPYSFDLIVTVSSTVFGTGIFAPATITLPPGASTHTFVMIPGNNFMGGVVSITFQASTDRGERCESITLIDFGTPCNQVVFKQGEAENSKNEILVKIQKLEIAPNPANHATDLYFEFPDNIVKDGSIEVYDVIGRLLDVHKPEVGKGKWSLSLQNFAAGHYIVLMKRNDQILIQKNLIVK